MSRTWQPQSAEESNTNPYVSMENKNLEILRGLDILVCFGSLGRIHTTLAIICVSLLAAFSSFCSLLLVPEF